MATPNVHGEPEADTMFLLPSASPAHLQDARGDAAQLTHPQAVRRGCGWSRRRQCLMAAAVCLVAGKAGASS